MSRDDEEFYDREVAPLLQKVMELCRDRGIPLVAAAAQYSDRAFACFIALQADVGVLRRVEDAARALAPEAFEPAAPKEPN